MGIEVSEVQWIPTEDGTQKASTISGQMQLDNFVKHIPETTKWSKEGLLEYIIQFVIDSEQVCLTL